MLLNGILLVLGCIMAVSYTHLDVYKRQEEEYPYEPKKLLTHPHMLVFHEKNGHVLAFTAGQHAKNYGHSDAKYEKFVYSNRFAFSVPRGYGLVEGAFDNTLAVSAAGEERYQMRWGMEDFRVDEQSVWVKYRLMPGVTAESTIIPWGAWHMRIHKIETEIAIDIADGGFALAVEQGEPKRGASSGKYMGENTEETENGIYVTCLLYTSRCV